MAAGCSSNPHADMATVHYVTAARCIAGAYGR